MALLEIRHLSKSFGGFAALTDVSIDIAQGERFGLIGPNGSGKTTLINCISGALLPQKGTVRLDRKSTRLNSSHITPSRMPSSA